MKRWLAAVFLCSAAFSSCKPKKAGEIDVGQPSEGVLFGKGGSVSFEIDDSFKFGFQYVDFLGAEPPLPGWQIIDALKSDEFEISRIARESIEGRHHQLATSDMNNEELIPLLWVLKPSELRELDNDFKARLWYVSP